MNDHNPLVSLSSSATMGIDLDRFEGGVEESLICPLCSKVLQDPIEAECGHAFCSNCFQKKKTCTKCNAKTTESTEVPDELLERLGKLSIHCAHYSEDVQPLLLFRNWRSTMQRSASSALFPANTEAAVSSAHTKTWSLTWRSVTTAS